MFLFCLKDYVFRKNLNTKVLTVSLYKTNVKFVNKLTLKYFLNNNLINKAL